MKHKILIANRGEIARRVIRTCQRLGIETVAICGRGDTHLPHVLEASTSVKLNSKNPYIDSELIIHCATITEATAIHPGYGFLSERADFAQRVVAAGLDFIGPNPQLIETLGDKHNARELAAKLGIPILAGVVIDISSAETIKTSLSSLQYPIMLKASGAGGGRAMRRVQTHEQALHALEEVLAEARMFGGNMTLIAERLLTEARHIEVQVCGFANGTVIHLGERDCSLQRRFQKLIEEAPAIGLTESLKNSLYDAATTLCAAATLNSLATVEFLVLGSEFYFLEVNPRIQVEHTITEEVTGLDLVELQIRSTLDPTYSLSQHEVNFCGSAVQVRIVAESPESGFTPSMNQLEYLKLPEQQVRLDHAMVLGHSSNLAFDSLLGKLIVRGPTITAARSAARKALQQLVLLGPATNIHFIASLLTKDDAFTINDLDDTLLKSSNDVQFAVLPKIAAVCAFAFELCETASESSPESIFSTLARFGRSDNDVRGYHVRCDSFDIPQEEFRVIESHEAGSGPASLSFPVIRIDNDSFYLLQRRFKTHTLSAYDSTKAPTVMKQILEIDVRHGNENYAGICIRSSRGYLVALHGFTLAVTKSMPVRGSSLAHQNRATAVSAPLPGTVCRISVQCGDSVTAGQPLITLESMKMEHTIQAPRAAVIHSVAVSLGDRVEKGTALLELVDIERDTP